MEAKELMKGNLVMYYNKIHRIQTVGQWCHTDLSSDEIPIDKLKPIPLTEEWLVRFGFDKVNEGYECDKFIIEKDFKSYLSFSGIGDFLTEIKYIHQLQNLYFALTGQELEYKE